MEPRHRRLSIVLAEDLHVTRGRRRSFLGLDRWGLPDLFGRKTTNTLRSSDGSRIAG